MRHDKNMGRNTEYANVVTFRNALAHLNKNVEGDVKISAVDKHVGQKSPNFMLLIRIEQQHTLGKLMDNRRQ